MSVPEMSKYYILRGWISKSIFHHKNDKMMKFRLFSEKYKMAIYGIALDLKFRVQDGIHFCVILQHVL